MLKNYLKITFRSLWRNKMFVLINVSGLGIAIACCITAYLNWDYNQKFDVQHVNAEKIYRVNFMRISSGVLRGNGSCPMPLGRIIEENISQVDQVVRFYPGGGNFKIGDELFRTGVVAADPNFLDVFTFPLVSGQNSELQDKTRIFISTEISEKYFPDIDPVGEQVTYVHADTEIEYIVAGVFEKMPQNSSFQFDALVNFDNTKDIFEWDEHDWALFNTTFITVNNPSDVPEIEKQLKNYVEIQNKAKEDFKVDSYYLDPFVGMAIRAEKEDLWNHWFNNSLPVAAASAPGIMAILILLIACFNFTNTSIAIANRRIKEIGIRKVMGSRRNQLIAQFLGENILLCFFALVVGLLIAEILVPGYSTMWAFLDIELNYSENIGLILLLISLLIFTGIIAGSYPAFYVSRFQPSSILRGTLKFGKTSRFTRVLLSLQFAISIIAIIAGFLFAMNAEYQKNYDLGFSDDGTIYARIEDEDDYNAYKNSIESNSMIKSIAGTQHNILTSWYTDPIKFESSEIDADLMDIGDNYLNTINATLLEGRKFVIDSRNDIENSVIVNEELVRIYKWENPIGKRIVLRDTVQLYVVGVVKDMYLRALWGPVRPLLLRYTDPENYRMLVVQTEAENTAALFGFMEKQWKEIFPNRISTVEYMNENTAESADVNNNIKIIFIFLGVVATLLSATGLFSLVSLNIIRRMKEIGVRKVLGATIPHIMGIMNKEFIAILAAASILGSVASYFLVDSLMSSIWEYHIDIGPVAFILSIFILFFISAVTVSGKVYKAATENPAYTLRDE